MLGWFSAFSSDNDGAIPSSVIDKQFLAAPIKRAVDKYQLLPEFLKVCRSEIRSFVFVFPVFFCFFVFFLNVILCVVFNGNVGEGFGEAAFGFI